MRIPVRRIRGPAPRSPECVECEEILYHALLDEKIDVVRQYAFDYNGPFGPARFHADLAIPKLKLVIEIDGPEHQKHENILRDMKREKTMAAEGWKILRFRNSEVRANPKQVVLKIIGASSR